MNHPTNTGRIWLIFVMLTLVGGGVFGRILHIQIAEFDQWTNLGEVFSSSIRSIKSARGQILAKDGRLLATSIPVYDLTWDAKSEPMDWEMYHAYIDSLCVSLSETTDKSKEYIRGRFDRALGNGTRGALIVRDIPFTAYKALKEHPFVKLGRYQSGLVFVRQDNRKLPFGSLAARTIGIDREHERVGVELQWNDELAGVEGKQWMQKLPGNQWMPVTDEYLVDPEEGLDVLTTLDLHIQDVASTALEQQLRKSDAAWGTVVVCEVSTGRIRAIANLRKDEKQWARDSTVVYQEAYNYAIGERTEPGSTFKLATLMACLEEGMSLTDTVDTKDGKMAFYGGKEIKDSHHETGGYGKISLKEVFQVSSNVGTALAVKQTYDGRPQAFIDRLKDIGVTEKTGIKYVGEEAPIYREPSNSDWADSDMTSMAIGYSIQLTPLQTLTLYNAVANGGKMVRPQLVTELQSNGRTVKEFPTVTISPRICSSTTLQACQEMMESVCVAEAEVEGTAAKTFKNKPYKVAGKTGTARYNPGGRYSTGSYLASFAGYFPADQPRYSCIVVVAKPKRGSYYGGDVAAPVFAEVADMIYVTESQFHEVERGLLAESTAIPTSKNGSREDLLTIYNELGISYTEDLEAPWVTVKSEDDHAELFALDLSSNDRVPNVQGMALRDALFLLENRGLSVSYTGHGIVSKQSLLKGTLLTENVKSIQLELK